MTVLLVTNPTKDSGYAVTGQTAALLHQLGVAVIMAQPVFESKVPIRFLPEEEAYREADLVITIGGDGTLLKAGLGCVHYGKPVLGVNLGRTGFLATCEVEELPEKLRLLAEGRYTLDARGLLLAKSANGWQAEAINDVVLFGRTRMHPMDYKVYCDGCFVSSYRSDGLILATPTGSTAYSFSAGGPVLDAAADVVVLTPVCAHNAQVAPLVFAAGRKLELVADAENRDTCYACADSTAQCDLRPGDVLTVTAAPQKLQLITFYDSEQFHAIENKLMRS